MAALIYRIEVEAVASLTAENEGLRAALRQLINDHLDICDDTCEAAEDARAALETK